MLALLFLLAAQNLPGGGQNVQGLPPGYGYPVQISGALTDTELRASPVPISGSIDISFPPSLAVTGPLTNTELRATPVPVSGTVSVGTVPVTGTFYQATQPVSISGSIAVTGSFYQATQPVSIASMPSTPVTGSFYPATQPVSGTFWQATQPVSGTFWQTTQPISGTVTANAGSGTLAVSGTFWQATQPVSGTVTITPPTLTKGTQGSTGLSIQDLKDAGRTTLAMTSEFTFAQTSETLLTMTLSSNSGATTTFSSRVITSGKRLRLQTAVLEVEGLGSGTAPQRAYLRMKSNTAGATTTSSPLQQVFGCGVTTAIVKASNTCMVDFPDGFELAGDGTATFGFSLETPDWVVTTATGRAKITVIGFEY